MRFALSDDGLGFADAVRDALGSVAPPAHVRRWWDAAETSLVTPPFTGDGPWQALVDMGVVSACLPGDVGGAGLRFVEMVGVCEELGAAALPEPVVATAVVAAPLLADLAQIVDGVGEASPEVVEALEQALDDVVAGAAAVAVAPQDDTLVECADAGWLLVEADGGLHLVDGRSLPANALVPQRSVDGARRVARLDRAHLDLSAATQLCGTGEAATAWVAARRRAEVACAAQLVGLGRPMLALTVDYVNQRRQFGVPVGSFQAVKHQLADAALHLEFAVPPVRFAAAVLSGVEGTEDAEWGPLGEPQVAVSTAKAAASDAAEQVAAAALQCHGAIGYTVEHDLHLYMKRTWALARSHGDAATHRSIVATHLLR
ncbi:MAG: acyl-CoA dehydrogenase family protein [Acidimicrobiia bacterium]|nr:acyl-CoA dehydrogenase family protein [Acidimicrobiia bacterium]